MKSRETNLKQMRSNFFGSAGWDNLEFEEWIESMDDFFAEAARTVKVGGSLIMFMSLIKIETIIKLAEKHGFYYKTTGIWHKLNPMPRNMNLHFINSTEHGCISFIRSIPELLIMTEKPSTIFLKHQLPPQAKENSASILHRNHWL